MKKLLIFAVIGLFACLAGCGSSHHQVNNRNAEIAREAIDSVMAPDTSNVIRSVSFIETKMPALWADTLEKSRKNSAGIVGMYLLGMAFSDQSVKTDEEAMDFARTLIDATSSYRKDIKEYEKSDSPEYLFGLATIKEKNDTSKIIKTIFVFDKDDPKTIIKTLKYTSKSRHDLPIELMISYIDDANELKNNKELNFKDFDFVKTNPIYSFLLED